MLDNVLDGVIADLRRRSKNSLYLTDPALWAKEVLGKDLWSKQREIAQSVVENTHTAVVSCNGAGKSGLAGILAVWWVATHDPRDVAVICSAPTYVQIARVLFTEIKTNFDLAKGNGVTLPGSINQSQEWKLDDGYVMAWGRRPADKDLVSSFQGIHRRYVMVILDEAGGIPEDLYTATEAVTNTEGARVLAIGNPDQRGTPFHKIFRDDPTWHKIKISAFDTPNFTDEKNEVQPELLPLLIQPAWVERQKISWGEDSARYKSKILAEFPDEDDTAFYSQTALDKAIDAEVVEDEEVKVVMGVDLARFGEDDSVIYINRGGRLRKYASWSKASALESANRVHQAALELGCREVRVDGAGLGGPVVDQLAAMGEGKYTVISMLGSASSPDKTRWFNARAYNFDSLREQMLAGLIDIDPDDSKLLEELMMLRYKFAGSGAIQIESKDDMRSRGVKSPDNLDAAVYASVNLDSLFNSPHAGRSVGDVISMDPATLGNDFALYDAWTW